MPDKTPAEKLRLKPGMSAALLHLPEGMGERLGVPEGVTPVDDPKAADFILEFASTQAEAEARVSAIAPAVGPRTAAWIAYPKGSKAAGRDCSRDTIAAFMPSVGMVVNANFSIDETWSALRFRPL